MSVQMLHYQHIRKQINFNMAETNIRNIQNFLYRFIATFLLVLSLVYIAIIIIHNQEYTATLKTLDTASSCATVKSMTTSNTVIMFCRVYLKVNGILRSLFDNKITLPLCPAVPSNPGHITITNSSMPMERLERLHQTTDRGEWKPTDCAPRFKIALIVPFRDRDQHLQMFLHHMHPFLQKQQLSYRIFIIEQTRHGRFNRGSLMNVGFIEANKLDHFDCFIFHDVDLLPENDLNLYWCPTMPRHMAVAVNTLGYKLPYSNIFGGVEAFRPEHFRLVNGFSNLFFGWGGEDDDLYVRVVSHKLNVTRYPRNITRYRMLSHENTSSSSVRRIRLLRSSHKRLHADGLSNLRYRKEDFKENKLYTRIIVTLNETLLGSLK